MGHRGRECLGRVQSINSVHRSRTFLRICALPGEVPGALLRPPRAKFLRGARAGNRHSGAHTPEQGRWPGNAVQTPPRSPVPGRSTLFMRYRTRMRFFRPAPRQHSVPKGRISACLPGEFWAPWRRSFGAIRALFSHFCALPGHHFQRLGRLAPSFGARSASFGRFAPSFGAFSPTQTAFSPTQNSVQSVCHFL